MEQTYLFERSTNPIYVYYREIQSTDLHQRTITESESVLNFNEVLDGFEAQTGQHQFSELDMEPNPEMLIDMIFNTYPEHDDQSCAMLVNDFCSSMMTSARQEGKYAVLIVTADSIFICHTDSKEKSITKNVDVIERLLDTDNVNKYAEFRQQDGETIVRHYERHQTKSLSGWLGISESQISYRDAGEVQIFTEIDSSTCAFQYTRDEFEEKFLLPEGNYELIEGVLRTPNNEYSVTQVNFGMRSYDDTEEFLQDFHSLYYEVKSYREHFNQVASSMEPFQSKVYDDKNYVTEGKNGRNLVLKEHNDFNIVFASNKIEIAESWLVDLVQRFNDGTETQIYHAGRPFSKDAFKIGNFHIYNETDAKDLQKLNHVYERMQKAGTSDQLSNILSYVIFSVASDWLESPLSHFFSQMTEKYAKRLDAEGVVLRDEDEIIEFKARDWFTSANNEDTIADRIAKEIQGDTRLLVGGIDEEKQQIKPIDGGRFDSERNQRIRDKVLERNGNLDHIYFQKINLHNGDCLLFVFSTQTNDFTGLKEIV
ncbi:hypothetical protein [Natrarchaeobius chitinivorans]|uniref:Uncharacterized protein n=1 Tax=Natrarchaeobius chitinivorans TaxID=1679083 RepID=A0A3N6MHX5_NATCH|nr:hypothetical protein [Natrarchaeobius chitinivorans]RQG95231.1 hypothetical protein EA473_09845 [Natrarchaeobius chitinivorans]